MQKSLILGDEYDMELRSRLLIRLKEMGATSISNDWAIVGSQEFETLIVQIGNNTIEIEAETYVGLSISGPSNVIDNIAMAI